MAPKRKRDEAENPDESFVVTHTPNLKRKQDEAADPDEAFVVAHTPNLTCRHKSLLANITSILPAYQKKKKSYKCPSGQRNKILKWTKCTTCLFLQYDENDQNLFLWEYSLDVRITYILGVLRSMIFQTVRGVLVLRLMEMMFCRLQKSVQVFALKLMDIFEGSTSSKVYLDDTIVKNH